MHGDETILLISVVEHGSTRDLGEMLVKPEWPEVKTVLILPYRTRILLIPSDEYPYPLYHHFIDNRVTKIDGWYYIITL